MNPRRYTKAHESVRKSCSAAFPFARQQQVNGDGNLDAVFANDGQTNRVCLGDGAGGFTCSNVSGDANDSRGITLTGPGAAPMGAQTAIPTLSEWGLLAFFGTLGGYAVCQRIAPRKRMGAASGAA